jgi:hypothetical protein
MCFYGVSAHFVSMKRPSLMSGLMRKVTPSPLLNKKAKSFASENAWLADVRVVSRSLPLGYTWVCIDDREGHMISIEGRAGLLMDVLGVAQDQWDIARQYIGRIMALETYQFETCKVLFKEGLSLDSSIEASRRL